MARRKKSRYDKYFSPRTHTSITAFSKNAGGATKRRKSYTERKRNRIITITLASILGAAVIFVAAFFITDTMIGVSNADVEKPTAAEKDNKGESSKKPQTTKPAPAPQKNVLHKDLKAKVLASSALSNPSSLDSTIKSLKSAGINSVIIDFKDEKGQLYYKSAIEKIKDKEVLKTAQENAPAAVKKLQGAGINVVARVYCFKDPMMPRLDKSTAATYKDTQSLWLDNDPKKGGKPWMNPYSKSAADYLTAVVSEVSKIGVDYIMLDGVQFPNLYSPITTFKGEKTSGAKSRNAVLVDFVNSCVKAANGTPVIAAMNGEIPVAGKSKVYGDGSLFNSSASLFAVDASSLKADAEKKYPANKKVVEIKAAPQKDDTSYILAK